MSKEFYKLLRSVAFTNFEALKANESIPPPSVPNRSPFKKIFKTNRIFMGNIHRKKSMIPGELSWAILTSR